MRTNKRTFPAAEVAPEDSLVALDLEALFGRAAPIEMDLGCGDGTMLVTLAKQNPERNFLGVERLPGRIRGACRKIGDSEVSNARVLRSGILEALQQHLPPLSVEGCHLLFPDPWPKRRHHDRRIVTEEFLVAVARVLLPGGFLRIATDHAEYFAHMQQTFPRVSALKLRPPGDIESAVISTFESRFRARGLEIHRAVLRKI